MVQNFPRFCPRCGTTTDPNQRFCARCGLDLAPRLPYPQDAQIPAQQVYQPSQPGYQQGWGTPPAQHFSQSAQANYTEAPSVPVQAGSKSGRARLGIILVLLLVLATLGVASFVGLRYLGLQGTTTQSPATTTSINATVTYAGITMTLLKVEQAKNFIDDPASTDNGMLRIHFQAQNKTALPVNLMYNSIARLIAPGGKTLTPTFVKANIGVAPGATQVGIIDFAAPADTKVNQYTFRLGASDEVQMDVPLTEGADLTRYAPKTTKLNGTLQYLGLDWSLVSATAQLSVDGKQASKGMRYVRVTLKVNNTLSQTAIPGSAYDYMRVKAGDITITPMGTTLPVSFAAGVTGKTGTVTFLVPQNTNVYTLILLAQPQGGFDQATRDFQLS